MRKARYGCAVAAVGILLLAACGDGTDDDTTGAEPGAPTTPAGSPAPAGDDRAASDPADPCTLLTEQEIADLVGAEVSDTVGPVEEFMGTQCEWYFPGGEFGDGQITVTVWVGEEFYSPEAPGAEATGFVELSGIGDAAHAWPPSEGICTVIFRTGEHVVQVLATDSGDEVCVDLASIADTRV